MENNNYNLNDNLNLPLDNNGKNPFGMPKDYFLKFEDKLRNKLELDNELTEFTVLSSIEKKNMFLAPENYFELTQDRLEYKTEFIEELNSFQTLNTVEKLNPFYVSENYFEDVTSRIKERLFNTNQINASLADVLLRFVFGKKIAFSFGLILFLGLAVYFYQSPENVLKTTDCKTLACLERQEILNNNKVITNFDEEQLMDLVDVNSLNQQLNFGNNNSNTTIGKINNIDSINEDKLLDEL